MDDANKLFIYYLSVHHHFSSFGFDVKENNQCFRHFSFSLRRNSQKKNTKTENPINNKKIKKKKMKIPSLLLAIISVASFVSAQDPTSAPASDIPGPIPITTTTTAAPAPAPEDKSWGSFGVACVTFFSALALWTIICYFLSKWEDKQTGNAVNNSAVAPGASIGDHHSSSGESSSNNKKYAADTSYSGGSTSGDGGYMPVAIPVTPTGGEYNSGNRI